LNDLRTANGAYTAYKRSNVGKRYILGSFWEKIEIVAFRLKRIWKHFIVKGYSITKHMIYPSFIDLDPFWVDFGYSESQKLRHGNFLLQEGEFRKA